MSEATTAVGLCLFVFLYGLAAIVYAMWERRNTGYTHPAVIVLAVLGIGLMFWSGIPIARMIGVIAGGIPCF